MIWLKLLKINKLAFRGGVNASNNATFRLDDLKSNLMFLLCRIKMLCHLLTKHSILCHPELVSGSHKCIEEKLNLPSYRTCCGIFKKVLRKIPQCVPLMRDDVKIRHTFKKALAFTLAETLIVMGIIGVVAALTIPNLNSSTADKEKIAKIKKIYQNLEDAQGRAVATYGPLETWFISDKTKKDASNRYSDRIMDFLKVSKDCNQSVSGCFQNKNYKDLDNTDHGGGPNDWPDDRKFNLADGTSISISIEPIGANVCARSDDSTKIGESNKCGGISVDIDGGLKGRNAYGVDFFQFSITTDGILPTGIENSGAGANVTNLCFKKGISCAGWVIANDNMDYLKATNGTCKHGKVLSWTNTSCK